MSLSIAPDATRFSTASRPVGKAEKAARDFEAVLLGSLMDSLQKTFSGNSEDASAGTSDYGFMGAQALASALAARGGIGIAQLILSHWRQTKVPGTG
jgi:Rod binding domain-containing protein